MSDPSHAKAGPAIPMSLAAALMGYACARVLEIVPTPIPRLAIVALDVLSAMAFALIAGTRHYGFRTMLVFVGICAVIGNAIENIGVVSGLPFGHYYFVELMGPRLFHVPILLGLAYIGMAYVSFILACVIAGRTPESSGLPRIIAVSLLAGCIMTAWDLAQDPVWATVLHGWTWRDGGPWFGVPVSNYLGWLGTVSLICLVFALYLQRSHASLVTPDRTALLPALLFYSVCAAGNICQMLPRAVPDVVQDPTGKLWHVADITRASALISFFVMGGFVVLAWLRVPNTPSPATATD